MLPTGRQLSAARVLAGLDQKQLAKLAGLDPSTVSRMEASDLAVARGHGRNIEAVLIALEKKGVTIAADGSIQQSGKPRR